MEDGKRKKAVDGMDRRSLVYASNSILNVAVSLAEIGGRKISWRDIHRKEADD